MNGRVQLVWFFAVAVASSARAEKLETDGQQALGLYATFQNAHLKTKKTRSKKGLEERLSIEKTECIRREDRVHCGDFTPSISESLYEILQESGVKESCDEKECRLTIDSAVCTRTTASDDIQWACSIEH